MRTNRFLLGLAAACLTFGAAAQQTINGGNIKVGTLPSTAFTDGNTGTGSIAHAVSPAFTTPALGVVINAVVDALSEFGVRHVEMPATPERIWRAIRDARRR